MTLHGIIISGGSGTRLWPLSRTNTPKQFIPLFIDNDTNLFQDTLNRVETTLKTINNSNSSNNLIIISSECHKHHLQSYHLQPYHLTSDILNHNNKVENNKVENNKVENNKVENNKIKNNINIELLLEPLSRDTAMAIATSMFRLFRNMKDDSIEEYALVCPSDHFIPNNNEFNIMIKKGYDVAKNNYLVTFGINPTHAETGYGYILKSDIRIGKDGWKVSKFTEKPCLEKAKEFINSKGNYTWNSGIFLFPIRLFLSELKTYRSDIYHSAKAIIYTNSNNNCINLPKDIYLNSPKISIDYALLEKSNRIAVVPTDLLWNDVGSWKSLWDVHYNKNNNNNIIVGDVISKSNSNCFIRNDDKNKKVVTVGLNDISVIVQDDVILILNMNESQQIKDIVSELPKHLS